MYIWGVLHLAVVEAWKPKHELGISQQGEPSFKRASSLLRLAMGSLW